MARPAEKTVQSTGYKDIEAPTHVATWHKIVMCLGAAIFAALLFLPVKDATNSPLQLLSGGAFLFGIGGMIRPKKPAPATKNHSHP